MGRLRPTPIGAVALLLLAGSAFAADGPPTLDVEGTCRSAAKAGASTSGHASVEGCLRSERDARTEARRRWGDYTPAAKDQCGRQFQAGGYPSYVEMVTCLELASGAAPTQTTGGGATQPAEKASGHLSPEPRANQRTNPIDVLEKPNR